MNKEQREPSPDALEASTNVYLMKIALNAAMQFPIPPKTLIAIGLRPQDKALCYAKADIAYPPGYSEESITVTTPGYILPRNRAHTFTKTVHDLLWVMHVPLACDAAAGSLILSLSGFVWSRQESYTVFQWQHETGEMVIATGEHFPG